jgi:hypothetical protein
MALTGIVFAIAFVMVQFSASAYSPRLVVVFGNGPTPYHTLGIVSATFGYSLAAPAWTNRGESGTAPLFSSMQRDVASQIATTSSPKAPCHRPCAGGYGTKELPGVRCETCQEGVIAQSIGNQARNGNRSLRMS